MSAQTDWLDGPKLVAWLKERGLTSPELQLGGQAKRIREWRKGSAANVFTADRVLVKLGLHLAEVPDDFYCEAPCRAPRGQDGTRRHFPDSLKAQVVDRCLNGEESIGSLAREIGAGRSTVQRWVKAAA